MVGVQTGTKLLRCSVLFLNSDGTYMDMDMGLELQL